MRHFSFARRLRPAQQAEAAAALRWLEIQPVPAGCPAGVVPSFRYIVAVAKQFQDCELGILELVMAGYRTGVVSLAGEPGKLVGLWGWRIRQGMIEVMVRTQRKKADRTSFD